MAKILFVEDEPDIRDLVRMALEDVHGVTVAGTAEEGLRRAAELAPDLILMDVSLGGAFDGLEATRRLRADPRFDTTPIIDRKSTRLNSSHANISYAVFCLTKKQQPPLSYTKAC